MENFEENNILGMFSEVISEGIIIVNDQRQITASNNAANKMFDYREGELLGESLDILIPERIKDKHSKLADRFMGEGKARQMGKGLDLVGVRKDGEEFPLEISLNPFKLKAKRYVLALIMDISEKRRPSKP